MAKQQEEEATVMLLHLQQKEIGAILPTKWYAT